jgi:hypothetical protein
LSTPDQHDTPDKQRDADQTRRVNRTLGQAQPSEMVEGDRTEHLPGDEQRKERHGADLWHKENAEADEDRAEETAAPRPPRDAGRYAGLGRWVSERKDEQGHAGQADGVAHEARPRR